ncbi:NUP85 [Candida theae]|uniref:Nuclear pore complex protein Nup85 n=1 Tax=Candida theae TaxID=1198502 RepID=A0AAD5BCB7_9ASCO|nr:NUP85 [Candida theae]KAI5950485.1 NUP85 [Candida theae]
MNRDFKDIEMLDIPMEDNDDVDTSVSSVTEGIVTDSPTSNEEVERPSTPRESLSYTTASYSLSSYFSNDSESIPLFQWLSSDTALSFEFDHNRYRSSLHHRTALDNDYIKYIETNFKTIEDFEANLKIADEESFSQPIGVITRHNEAPQLSQSQIIDDAYDSIVDHLTLDFVEQPRIDDSNSIVSKFNYLLVILECLRATCFSKDVRRRPDIIVKWVNLFDSQPSAELVDEVMTSNSQCYAHPLFWNTLLSKCICRGLFDQSVNILEHSYYQELEGAEDDLYHTIRDLQTLLLSYTAMADKGQFSQWKSSACEFRDSLSSVNISTTDTSKNALYRIMLNQIYDVACILTGFARTIANYCENWYELYLAYSLFQIRDDETVYQEYFSQAIKERPPLVDHHEYDDFDELTEFCLLQILEGKFLKALEGIFDLDPATAAYASLLLEHKGYLDPYYSTDISKNGTLVGMSHRKRISEYFLLNHAYNCLNIHPLVPVGIGILSNRLLNPSPKAQERNKRTIAHFLPKYEIVDNDDQEWALTVCADLHLASTAKDIYYQAGLRALGQNNLYEALENFVNCYDPNKSSGSYHKEGLHQIQHIVWEIIFTDCLVCNKPIQDELINSIVDQKVDFVIHSIIQQCISPYAVLKQFYDSLKSGNPNPSLSVSRLVHLLNFNFLPDKFKPLLLCQFLPLLKGESKLRQADLFTIAELIESYEGDTSEQNKVEGEKLYTVSISHKEEEGQLESYDWRRSLTLPSKFSDMLKLLRRQTTIQIGRKFVEY